MVVDAYEPNTNPIELGTLHMSLSLEKWLLKGNFLNRNWKYLFTMMLN